jgi:hypothetical protein
MPRKRLVLLLAATLLAAPILNSRSAEARDPDLVRATAALVLAEEPPPTRSQVLEKQRREEAARAQLQVVKKEPDTTPYYKKWWFWALSAAVVGGTVALGAWAIEPSTKPANSCSPGVVACFGDGRMAVR